MPDQVPSNFIFLEVHDVQLVRFGMLAEGNARTRSGGPSSAHLLHHFQNSLKTN